MSTKSVSRVDGIVEAVEVRSSVCVKLIRILFHTRLPREADWNHWHCRTLICHHVKCWVEDRSGKVCAYQCIRAPGMPAIEDSLVWFCCRVVLMSGGRRRLGCECRIEETTCSTRFRSSWVAREHASQPAMLDATKQATMLPWSQRA